jgi:putative nucleotidyltransferase with HDIG domain
MNGAALQFNVEELLEQFRAKRVRRLIRRELTSELVAAAAFVVAATALVLAAPWQPAVSWPVVIGLGALYAEASRVRFEVWSCHTDASQLALIPALMLLPPGAVPLLAAAAYIAGEVPDYLRGRQHPERIVVAVANSWYAIGPALVVAMAGGIDGLRDWPVLAIALVAQFAADAAMNSPREWFELGASPRAQLPSALWTYGVDALLSSVGFAAGLASLHEPYAFLLMLPLVALMAIFAGERERRLDSVLQLSEAYRGTTLLLSELVEHDDEYTGVHSQGVVELALLVSDELGIPSRRNVEFGALLHDVGKMAVPKEIINKDGPLTDEEWEKIKAHTITGQRMLDRVGGTLSEVGRIVRWSHERWDGGGYPDGLAGEDIPIESRIISCCDAFDAMTTDRAYRSALPVQTATRELLANAGSQFDPGVASTVARLVETRN